MRRRRNGFHNNRRLAESSVNYGGDSTAWVLKIRAALTKYTGRLELKILKIACKEMFFL